MSQENTTGIRTFVAAAALEAFRRVKLDSNGKAVYADADDIGIGTTLEEDAASGEHVSVRLWNFPGTRKITCAGAVAKGARLFCMDAGKFDDASESGGPAVVEALAAGTGDGSIIEARPLSLDKSGGLLYEALADSAAVTNTTTATKFDKKKTIDGNLLKKGDVLRVKAQGIATATNATDTLKAELLLGTEVIADTGAVDVANNDIFYIDAEIVIVDVGASGKIRACGVHAIGASGAITAKAFRKAEAAEDLSVDVEIAVQATWSVANAGNSCKLEILSVEHIRQ